MAGYSVTYSVVDQATAQIDAINRRIVQMRAPLERQAKSLQKFVDVSGLKNVATGFGEIGKQAFGAFSEMSKMVPVLGTIGSATTVAGLVKMATAFASMSRELVQNADRIGVTSQKLQELETMMRLTGGSAADMDSTLQSLTTISRNAALGLDQNARAAFNRLNIQLRDANGQFRSAADLLPELMTKIGQLKDPTDRARVAAATLGDAQNKVYESFIHSSKSWSEWQTEAAGYPKLTDQQTAAYQRFSESIGRLTQGFSSLGEQVGVTIATALTPLVNWAGDWVKVHTPAIAGGIDTLITKHQDLAAAGAAVLSFFSLKFAAGLIGAVGRIASSFGLVGTGTLGAGGAGLLGALGSVLALITAAVAANKALQAVTPTVENLLWGKDTSKDVERLAQASHQRLTGLGVPEWMTNILAPTTGEPTGPPPGAAPGLATGPRVNALPTPSTSPLPAPMRTPGFYQLPEPTPSAKMQSERAKQAYDFFRSRGWSDAAATGLVARQQRESNFNPTLPGDAGQAYGAMQWHPDRQANFKQVFGHDIRQSTYQEQLEFQDWELRNTEKRSGALLANPNLTPAQAGDIVSRDYIRPFDKEGEAQKTGALASQYSSQYAAAAPPVAAGAPVQTAAAGAPGAPGAAGKVAVSITHVNPPPNTAITATGSGAVDVEPPRTERQQLAAA